MRRKRLSKRAHSHKKLAFLSIHGTIRKVTILHKKHRKMVSHVLKPFFVL
ncbi:hypothetical protein FH5_04355 [Priestia endophytica]|nr:hypothetical protein FH5_04355 [Priestia endophytica]